MVYELTVAPGITRFLALFDPSKEIEKIGPVRSARKSLADLAAGYGGAFVHAGGSSESLNLISSLPVLNIDEIYGSGDYFYRSEDRVAPHNLYTSSDLLAEGIQNRKRDIGSSSSLLPLGSVNGGTEATEIVTTFKGREYDTAFRWDDEAKNYTKYENDQKVITEDESSIQVENVIQVFVPHKQYYDGEWLVDVDMIGNGLARYYKDGKVWEGYWKKPSAKEPIEYYLEDDSKMLFNEGKTWVLVDESLTVDHMTPQAEENDVSIQSDIEIEFSDDIKEGTVYQEIQLKNHLNQPIEITKTIKDNSINH